MADLRIVDAPLLSTVKGTEKLPTGGEGNFSVSVNQVADFAKLKWLLATEEYVDNAVGNTQSDLNLHKNNESNPHNVTKTQVGLGNVDNTADLDKPVSNATQSAIITANSGKADKSYVDSQDQLKADKTTVEESLLLKADKVDLTASKIASDGGQTQQVINDFGGAKWYAKSGGYDSGAAVVLANGDIVKSTVSNNIINPNVDMIGWVKTNAASQIFDLSGKSQQEINNTLSVNVKSFGATGKGSVDDISAIKSALAFMQAFTGGGDLHFPAGIYNISEPIKITKTGITISGDGLAGAINFTSKTFSGSHILYTSNDGQAIVQFGDDSALLYIENVKNIKIGPAPTVTTKPLAALQFNAISEFYLDNVSLTGCTYNLDINSCNIGYVNNYVLASGDYNVRMRADSTVYTSGANASLFFSKGNMWKADKSHIRITASTASIISFSESWAEYAQRVFDIEQTSDVSMSVTIKLDKFSASTSSSFAPTDPAYNIANNRFLKVKAFQGGASGLRVRMDATDLIAFMQSANYLFEYEKGTNTSVNSYMDESILINPILYGAQLSVFKSDTISSSASLIGKVVANKGYANGVAVPLSDGNTSVGLLKSTIGAFDMREGKPFYLPQQSPSNINTAGQLYFDAAVNRPVYTSQFSAIRLPKPLLTTLNDADLIATLDGTGETIVLVNPLTANRVITLPSVGKYNGAKMRIVRQVGSTGAFTVNVGSLKNLSSGQWCDVECNSALNWVLTAFGSL